LYATWFDGGAYLNSEIEGGYNFYESRRASVGGVATGDTGGPEFDALLGGGYDFLTWGHFTFGPVGSLQYIAIGTDRFTETGSLSPLTVEHNNDNSFRSLLGARVTCAFPLGSVIVRPQLQLGWQHEFLDTEHAIDSRFASGA